MLAKGPAARRWLLGLALGAFLLVPASAVAQIDFAVRPTGIADFAGVNLGSFADQTFTVQNTGGGTVFGTVSTSPPFSVVSGSPFSLAGVGATTAVIVRFSPTGSFTVITLVNFTAHRGFVSRIAIGTGILGDATPPTVSITAPISGSTVSGTVMVSASAIDNVGVVGVQFQLDGTNLGAEVTATPLTASWDTTTVAGGVHTLTAVARDAAGNATTSPAVSVTVDPRATVNGTATPITLDGSLDEWSGATAVQFSGRSSSTTAYFLWDATNLYVAFQVNDSQLNAVQTVRDAGALYLDDTVEIHIDTLNDRASTMQLDDYHFLVNLNNAQRDRRGTGTSVDPTWNGVWQSAVRLQGTLNDNADTDTGYTVEIAIPWAQIGMTPVDGMTFGLHLAVDDSRPAGFDQFDWAGIAPNSYAHPSLWKQVRLVGTLPPISGTTPPTVAITTPTSNSTSPGPASTVMVK